jgi:hypothetical protein
MSPSIQGVSFERFQGSIEDPDLATAQTVGLMCGYISEAAGDPLVQLAARLSLAWGDPCSGAFWDAKHRIEFKSDQALMLRLLNEGDNLELLIHPSVIARWRKPQGDCDDFVMWSCALLCCCGLDFEIKTVAANPQLPPDEFSHVYARAVFDDGTRLPIDATPSGRYPGWEVPPARVTRSVIWNSAGYPIKDVMAGVQ